MINTIPTDSLSAHIKSSSNSYLLLLVMPIFQSIRKSRQTASASELEENELDRAIHIRSSRSRIVDLDRMIADAPADADVSDRTAATVDDSDRTDGGCKTLTLADFSGSRPQKAASAHYDNKSTRDKWWAKLWGRRRGSAVDDTTRRSSVGSTRRTSVDTRRSSLGILHEMKSWHA